MDKPSLLAWVIAPLTWLERAKGWKRAALALLYVMIVLVVGVLGWREDSLRGLPDIGEPFDLARHGTVDVSDSANAMVLYREAAAMLDLDSPSRYPVPSARVRPKTHADLVGPYPKALPEGTELAEPLGLALDGESRRRRDLYGFRSMPALGDDLKSRISDFRSKEQGPQLSGMRYMVVK